MTSSQVTVWLFGKPAWELEKLEGEETTKELLDCIEALGAELKERLASAAKTSRVLLDNGWSGSGGLYDIWFTKAVSVKQAEKELKKLDIFDNISLDEDMSEDEDEEFEEGVEESTIPIPK